jgi:hypothetical protein
LGCSEFARHYYRNHGCFLFLRVLRWFTSPGSLPAPMYSVQDTWCSHQVGSPIRTSPDHRLLAPPRSFSQLATSFFACLRQGIHTHALSSLTIKLTPYTRQRVFLQALLSPSTCLPLNPSSPKEEKARILQAKANLLLTRQIFSCQRTCLLQRLKLPFRNSFRQVPPH